MDTLEANKARSMMSEKEKEEVIKYISLFNEKKAIHPAKGRKTKINNISIDPQNNSTLRIQKTALKNIRQNYKAHLSYIEKTYETRETAKVCFCTK